jgi:hypothetical protein
VSRRRRLETLSSGEEGGDASDRRRLEVRNMFAFRRFDGSGAREEGGRLVVRGS